MFEALTEVIRSLTQPGGLLRVRSVLVIILVLAVVKLTADGTLGPEVLTGLAGAGLTGYFLSRQGSSNE